MEMKQILLIISLFCISNNLFAQETIFRVQKNPNGQNEEFYVLKSDEKIKHGTYVKYQGSFGQVLILESGSYNNGQKHGEWQYFYGSRRFNNSLSEKGTYFNGLKNGLWATYYLDTTANSTGIEKFGNKKTVDSLFVNVEQRGIKVKQRGIYIKDKKVGEWFTFDYNGNLLQKYNITTTQLLYESTIQDSTQLNLNRKGLFLGERQELINYLQETIGPFLPSFSSRPTNLLISITIDENGKTSEVTIKESTLSKNTNSNIIDVLTKKENQWIPALNNETKIKYTIQVGWKISKEKTAPNEERWKVAFSLLD